MDKLYRIGFDIGIGSVGWSVLENDPVTEDPCRILKMGVRTFSPNEVEKTGESTAKSRREKRGVHRRNRRRHLRLENQKKLLQKTLNVKPEDLQKINNVDVYALRANALDIKISNAEIAKIILNITKRRGFKSNRKSLTQSKEEGSLLTAINKNRALLEEKGYRTVGEAFYKDENFKILNADKIFYNVRNHGGDYKNCFLRDDLKEELFAILKKQQEFGNIDITEDFINKTIEIFYRQRNFDEGPGLSKIGDEKSKYSADFEVGKCTFENQEKRAPKASFTFEYFSALSKVNSLKIGDDFLTLEQKETLYNELKTKKELTFKQVRKMFGFLTDKTFNLCRYKYNKKNEEKPLSETELIESSEKATFVTMKNSFEICKLLGYENSFENREIIDEVALLLSVCKSDVRIDKYIENNESLSQLSQEQKDNIKTKSYNKFGSLSIKAMNKVIPYLLKGERYDVACKSAGYNHSSFEHEKYKFLKGDFVDERLKDVTSPVVKRAVNQTLRILNEIIKEYGSPQYVTIELARELSKDLQERNKIKRIQEQNYDDNEKAKQMLAEEFNLLQPTSFDLLKYRLYMDQDGKCMYSGKKIEMSRLYEPNYVQVDHILPYSRSMNDSYNNKVLVIADENQNKTDKTPFEWFGSDEAKWNDFVARVNCLKSREKRNFLLKQNFTQDISNDFIERNLNDTKYMSKFMLNLMQDYLLMKPSKHKKVVRSVNGAITNYLRRCWGVNKIREDGDVHHAIDATIIATTTEGQVKKITTYNNLKEQFVRKDDFFVNKTTGEVMTKQQKEEYENMGIDILSKYLPLPYDNFIKELELRSRINYTNLNFTFEEKLELAKLGYDEEEINQAKPIFVSRMKNVKETGAIHQETMMSLREYNQTKNLIKTVPIQKLSLENKPEEVLLKDDEYPNVSIKNYYKPQDDRLLYLKLKKHLIEVGSIKENEAFYKPKNDGTNGPVVRKVKVYEKSSMCVKTPNGGASNDTMYRVDVFEKDKKFYLCPVYMSDVYNKKLPNKVIQIGKDWLDIDDTFKFQFSLYKNDLVKVTNNKDIVLNKNFANEKSKKSNSIQNKEFLLYYNNTGIATASIKMFTQDSCYKIDNMGVKTLLKLEKYYVDIMGKIYKAPKEERKGF